MSAADDNIPEPIPADPQQATGEVTMLPPEEAAAVMAEIKAHEGAMVGITGLIKKGQHGPIGVGIAPGVRIMPGGSPSAGGGPRDAGVEQQTVIDVESWRLVVGSCRSR